MILGPRGYSKAPSAVLKLGQGAPTHRAQGLPLELVDPAGGQWEGVSLAGLDWDGDGRWELVVGADQGCVWYFGPEHFGRAADPEALGLARGPGDPEWP